MAWTTPITAVADSPLTAAQWNASVRDNLNMTAPAIATTSGSLFVGTGANAIAERITVTGTVATQQSTTSTTYNNLTTVGAQAAVTTGTKALGLWAAYMQNNTGGQLAFVSVSVSGATPTVVGSDTFCAFYQAYGSNAKHRTSTHHWWTGLTAGSNTFTMVYRVDAGTGFFQDRELTVIPF